MSELARVGGVFSYRRMAVLYLRTGHNRMGSVSVSGCVLCLLPCYAVNLSVMDSVLKPRRDFHEEGCLYPLISLG